MTATSLSAADLAAAASLLRDAERVWLGTHVDPDGDAVGSLLGLGWILRRRGATVTLACQDPPPPSTQGLPGVADLTDAGPEGHDVAVALDAGDTDRLGDLYTPDGWAAQPTLVVDHHVSNPGFGDVNLIDGAASSTAELVVHLARALEADIGPEAATCLLTGLVTDTMGFRTSNTSAATLDTARFLVERGAPLREITQRVFFNAPLANLCILGRALAGLRQHGPFAITVLRQADLEACDAAPAAMRGISAVLSTAAEPAAVALVREQPEGHIDVSLRSKPSVDLVPAARALGGGGHPQAAGARLDGPIDDAAEQVLRALEAHIDLSAFEAERL